MERSKSNVLNYLFFWPLDSFLQTNLLCVFFEYLSLVFSYTKWNLENFCWQAWTSQFYQKPLQNTFLKFMTNISNSGHALFWHWKSLSAEVPWCSPLPMPLLSISLGTYSIWSQSIKVTHLVIGKKRYSIYLPGWFLYLWEVYFCSTSCDLPFLGQLNNLHTYSCMTPAQTHGFQ